MTNIKTERLILRKFNTTDAKGIKEYLENPTVNCFKKDQIFTLKEAEERAEEYSNDKSKIAIALKDTDLVIGEVFCLFEKPDTYSIGWNFNPNYAGKGYAFESAKAIINDLFTNKSARRLYVYIEDDNKSSQKLAERLGMRKEGLFLEFISFIDVYGEPKYENTYQYALLKKEWNEHK